MLELTPIAGKVRIETFHNPAVCENPLLTLRIDVTFDEPVDPNDPSEARQASASIDGIPMPASDWRSLEGRHIDVEHVDEYELVEGTVYYYTYHNPIDHLTLAFGSFTGRSVNTVLEGVIDFTFEGLAHLGKPKFRWQVHLSYDETDLDSAIEQFNTRGDG